MRIVLGYALFGLGEVAVCNSYCEYRAAVGNPSDLPCNEPVWDMVILPAWPMIAFADAFLFPKNAAVPMPIHFKVMNVALLAGYLAIVIWSLVEVMRASSPIKPDS